MTPRGLGLVCAATITELESLGLRDGEILEPGRLWRIPEGYAAVTGVGIPATLLNLMPRMDALRPAWVGNIGVAGAYRGSGLEIGDVVWGISECFADLGLETPDGFIPLAEAPFADAGTREPLPLWVPEDLPPGGHRGRGATVNCCAGRDATGEMRRSRFQADFESMEGAAVAWACKARGIPAFELRTISNFAANRDMRPENLAKALAALRAIWAGRGKG